MKKYIFFVALVLFGSTMHALAQVAAVESQTCNAKFAQLLVEQQVMESKSVVDQVKRIKILLRSADFLWAFDQPVSREYFGEAYKVAEERFKELGFERKTRGESTATLVTILPDPRIDVIRAIAKKDPEWAKRLTEQILSDYDKSTADRKGLDKSREVDDLLYLAQQNIKTNPELSRYLYRRLMRYQLVGNWYFTLYGAADVDQAFADALYAEALQNYRNETPRRLLYLSAYPFATARILGVDKFQMGASVPDGLAANTSLQRQFLNVYFSRIAAFAASQEDINRPPDEHYSPEPLYMVSAMNEIEPIVIARFPDLLQRMSTAKAQANSLLSEEMRKKLSDKSQHDADLGRNFDESLAAVEKADSENKLTDFMIVQLVTWRDKTDEQFVKTLPWLDKIKEEKPRRETINYFWFLRSKLAIKEMRLDNAEKHAAKVPEIEHRALLFFDIARIQAKNERDIGSLFETLNGISKLVRTADNSASKAQILMGLSGMYEKANHSVALDELGEAVRVINALKDPDIFTGMIMRQISGKEFGFFAAFQTPGYNLETTFEELSKKDFEMSLANAKALDDKYFRTLAVIAVAGNCVKNSKAAPKPKQ